jgi:hypothetical protein
MSPGTEVRFNLWAVLGFLVLMGVSSFTFLYAEGSITKSKQQEVLQRLVVLETNYANIMKGISELKETAIITADKLEIHRAKTEGRK